MIGACFKNNMFRIPMSKNGGYSLQKAEEASEVFLEIIYNAITTFSLKKPLIFQSHFHPCLTLQITVFCV